MRLDPGGNTSYRPAMLVDLTTAGLNAEFEIAYATGNNLTGRPIYARPRALLLPEAAEKLETAIGLAARLGLRFRIYDAFRPSEAQWALWHAATDKLYVADPRKGGPHTRGAAVDLTLLDASGAALDMGGPFDEMNPNAWHDAPVSDAAQRNRHLLLGLMTAAGWDCYLKEWWHYQLFDPRRYPAMSDADAGAGMM